MFYRNESCKYYYKIIRLNIKLTVVPPSNESSPQVLKVPSAITIFKSLEKM